MHENVQLQIGDFEEQKKKNYQTEHEIQVEISNFKENLCDGKSSALVDQFDYICSWAKRYL